MSNTELDNFPIESSLRFFPDPAALRPGPNPGISFPDRDPDIIPGQPPIPIWKFRIWMHHEMSSINHEWSSTSVNNKNHKPRPKETFSLVKFGPDCVL